MLELKLFVLLLIANGSPVIASHVFGNRFACPLDGGLLLGDGQPLLGHSKKIRGIVSSMLLTVLAAPLLDLSWQIGLTISVVAMLGDLSSSFIKRRLKRPVSSQFIGLDQIPESLFPLLVCRSQLDLSYSSIALIVFIFIIGGALLSRVLYKLNIRRKPY